MGITSIFIVSGGANILCGNIMSRKLKGKFILRALKKHLKEHDWTYEMSDDHSYWLSGTAQREKIRKIILDAYKEGVGAEAEMLFGKHYPKAGCHAEEGYGIKINHFKGLSSPSKGIIKW